MASLTEQGDHSTVSSNTRSRVVVLKVGDALRSIGRDVAMSSVPNTAASKVVTIGVPPEQLKKILHHKPNLQALPTVPGLSSTSAGEKLTKPPGARRLRPVVTISELGSPLRGGDTPSVQKSDQEHLTAVPKRRFESTSDSRELARHIHTSPRDPLSLEEELSPPFRRKMSRSSFRLHMQPPTLNQQLGLSPPDWQRWQSQFQLQPGVSIDEQDQGSSAQVDRPRLDIKVSWPLASTPLRDLDHASGSRYAPLPHDLPANNAPSYEATFLNTQHFLPATMSAEFTAEAWNERLNVGTSSIPASATNTTNLDCFETHEEFKERLMRVLQQMMFVSGETAEASPETTGMIEEIVRAQVIEMLRQASELANRRGVRSISTADLIFLIRHDKAKVSRLKTFLSWKDVRKNVKDSDEKGGGDAGEVDFDDGANLPGAGPVDSKKSSNKKAKLILPWEVQSFYSEQVPEREDEEDNEEEEEQNEATLARLASADERTKNMTRDEYVYWSDCRQASFTFRKGKRFREWAGFGVVTDSKPNDDIVDILGFLTFEIVQTLTEEALKVKAAEDLHNARTSSAAGGETKKRKREGSSLFEMPEEGRTPVEPKHVREAFRRLQIIPKKYSFMRPGYAGMKNPLRLI